MAAAAVPRKQAASSAGLDEGPRRNGAWFPVDHDLISQIGWLSPTPCGSALLLEILSLVNQRAAECQRKGKPATGSTGLIGPTALMKGLGGAWELRMVQIALRQLSDTDYPTILTVDADAALQAGLITEQERGKRADLYCFTPNLAAWPEIVKRRKREKKERLAALKAQEAAEEPDAPAAKRPPIRITSKPIIRRPGDRAARVVLDAEARAALPEVEAIRVKGDQIGHISFAILENVLECSVAAPPSVSEATEGVQCIIPPQGSQKWRTDGERGMQCITPLTAPSNEGRKQGEGGMQCITPPQEAKNCSQVSETITDAFDLSDYSTFCSKARQKFPPTNNSSLFRVIQKCREVTMRAGLEPDWASDRVLVHAMCQRGVTPKIMQDIGYWLGKDDKPGTLVRCVANWAREFASTGRVLEADDLRPEWDAVREALEATRGKW